MMPPDTQPPRFDTELVKYIAYLVRLGISEEEAQVFGQQFETIIEYFNLLNEADLAGVEPAGQALQSSNILRDDKTQPSLPRPAFLANVPEHDEIYVQVPVVTGVE
jgi:aspartyl-tRNA(Asn)/glutamyl-tRNA(Gln) amidotransferase subunit C